MKRSIGAVLVLAVAFAASACGSSRVTSGPLTRVSANSVVQSRVIENGAVRCTATVLTNPVAVGDELGDTRVAFTFRNLSKHTVYFGAGGPEGTAIVRSPDGTTYDPLWEIEHSPGGVYGSTPIQPGATTTAKVSFPAVSWEGPLRITPSCAGTKLLPVRVPVTSPGIPRSSRAAVADVVAATGHLLDHCHPSVPGVPVVGEIVPPSGNLRSFRARCSVSLRREQGFYVAQLLVVNPPDRQGVRILPTYEQVRQPDIWGRNTATIAWKFVVTRSGATPIDDFSGTTAAAHWVWTRPSDAGDGVPLCGPESSGSSEPHSPDVYFLSSRCAPQKK